jgi:SET domain-containing protein
VALRDISKGEELTIDYGRAWQEAYRDFLQRLQSGKSATDVNS